MNLKVIDDDNFVLFIIDKKIIPNIDDNKVATFLKKTFLKIKENFNIDIYGYYDVNIYLDKYYGMIIKLSRTELEYLSYYDKQIEMKIIVSDNQVFYRVFDIYSLDKRIIKNSDVYLYEDKTYLELKKEINFILLGNLLENSEIVYENTSNIKKNGEKIEIRW